ncbi:LOW QUALITY PROTEIN: angiomotin-like protein 1 [Hyperolius riggenbachi]|uniref:LOW QUALITY PROTEIN: angiomotin-like protein 1 n=1 Tax=Hyperolius riggenbachi TaxID=752182 RepID=UPI0035A270A5
MEDRWLQDEMGRLPHMGIAHHVGSRRGSCNSNTIAAEFWSDQQTGALPPYRCVPVQFEEADYLYADCPGYPDNNDQRAVVTELGNSSREQAEEQTSNFLPQDFLRISEVEMRGSEDVATGNVLHRLIQEQLRYGDPNENMNLLAIQHQATGTTGPTNVTANSLSSTENLNQEDPQMVSQSARQEPQGQEHQVDSTVMEKTLRTSQPQQNNEELPTYEEAKAQSQFYRCQPTPIGHGFYVAGVVANHKSKTEGRATVNRANSGQAHQDEALKELKQGHVRSLSERIMLSLERNGVKQHASTTGSIKGLKNGAPSPAPSLGKGMEQRGPPPDYPHRAIKQAQTPVKIIQDQGHFYNEQQHPMVHEVIKTYPGSHPTRPEVSVLRYPPPPEYHINSRQQPPQHPFSSIPQQHHSPMSSQTSSICSSLHSTSLPLFPMGMPSRPTPCPSPSPNQPLPPEAFAIVERAHQMVEMLTKENSTLQRQLDGCFEKADKLQRYFETEIQKISEAYESLVKSSTKREALDKAMKNKLEAEIRRLHDFNLDLRDRLETANRQLANREYNGHEEASEEGRYALKNKEHLKEMEGLELELAALRTTNEDQRRHIEILEQALSNAQAKVIKLEEELRKKQVYVEEVEKLQQALTQLQAAGEKREQLERRLRTRLERELESLRMQQRQATCPNNGEYNTPALMDLLRKKEETILALEADTTKWQQKYLEESAMRHFTMDTVSLAASSNQDSGILNHSRTGSHSESFLEMRMWHEEEEIAQANRKFQDMEHTIKNLHAKIIEQDAMIKVLHQRSRKDQGKNDNASLRPARSVPSIAAVAVATSGTHSRQTSLTSNQLVEEKKEEKARKGSIGIFQGRDNHESPSPSLALPPPSFLLPPAASSPVTVSHAKTGSKDSSTQTDKSSDLFWPTCSSLPGRGRMNTTPSSSPLLRHTANKEKSDHSPILGKTLEAKVRSSNTAHKADFSEPDNAMEVLI